MKAAVIRSFYAEGYDAALEKARTIREAFEDVQLARKYSRA
jgi:hypothetical protein